jgi:RNA-directed DNA polymerase
MRCRKAGWVIDLGIRKFFGTVPRDLVVRAAGAGTDLPWAVLHVRRWLAAPLALPDGSLPRRDRGTPQGPAVPPVLASLFLHYALGARMVREFPGACSGRYADDAVVHCVSEARARHVPAALRERMREAGLELHPAETRIVYCQDSSRRGSYEHAGLTFPGCTFRPRGVRTRHGKMFTGFNPAISKDALTKISAQVRSWRLHYRTRITGAGLARRINPVARGRMNYYGAFCRSAPYPLLARISSCLMRWPREKRKRLRGRKKARQAWERAVARRPRFLARRTWVNWVPRAW